MMFTRCDDVPSVTPCGTANMLILGRFCSSGKLVISNRVPPSGSDLQDELWEKGKFYEVFYTPTADGWE